MKTQCTRQFTVLFWALLTLVGVAFVAGCDSKNKVETPSNTSVTLSAPSGSVAINTPVLVEATVMSGSSPVAGQSVTFSVNPSGDGSFDPSTATTDADGVAVTYFTGDVTGSMTIFATLTGSSTYASRGVSVTDASTGNSNVTVSLTPSLLLANGSDTSEVTIVVKDANNNPVSDGTIIKITAGERFVDIDGNGYWSNGIDSLVFDANSNNTWDAIGLVPSTATTSGGTGTATVNYISGNDALTVYIKVTVTDNNTNGSSEVSLQLTPNASINTIYLSSDSLNLAVTQTGGIETALLRASCFDVNGNRVPEGLPVSFIILDGPSGGEYIGPVGTDYGPYDAVTNSQGVASIPMHSGTISGTVRIRAYTPDAISNATQVLISAGPPAYIVVGAEDCNLQYWDVVGGFNPIVAVVSDIYLNPVPDSTVVYFSTDEGSMMSHLARTEELQGIAKSIWISGNNVSTADGQVLVMAETAGGTVADTSFFYNSYVPETITASGMPTTIPADGITKAVVVLNGADINGWPVLSGTQIDADATYLSVEGGTLEDGCFGASARVKITSSTLEVDNSMTGGNDNGIGAVDQVVYWCGGTAAVTYNVSLTTGFAYGGNSSVTIPGNAAVGEFVNISAIIQDRFGNPLGDHTLILSANSGTVTGASQETNSYGEAVGFRWTPSDTGSYTLTITNTDPRGSGLVLSKTVTVE